MPDWSGSGRLPEIFQNVVDLLSRRRQLFRQATKWSVGDCMKNADKSRKFHNFLKIRNSEDPLFINLAVAEYEILGDPYLGPKPHQKLTSSSALQI